MALKKMRNISKKSYKLQATSYKLQAKIIKSYDTAGPYLGAVSLKGWTVTENRAFDHNGIPKIKYGNYYYYNPVTVSQFALAAYGACKINQENCSICKAAISTFQYLQSDDGAYRYAFDWKHFRMPTRYKVG